MAVSVRVDGWENFIEFGRKLKAAGDKDLQREVQKGITASMRPLRAELRASARDTLPTRGGLAAVIAASSMRSDTRFTGRWAGARLLTSNKHDIRAIDRGRLRHPLFGDREHWYSQTVSPGWWSDPIRVRGPYVKAEIEAAMENVKNQIERGF